MVQQIRKELSWPGGVITLGSRQVCIMRGGECVWHVVTQGFVYNHELPILTPPNPKRIWWWR